MNTNTVYFYGDSVKLLQPKTGYRAGTDALLLSSALNCTVGEKVLELGCGSGAVLRLANHHNPDCSWTGLECDETMIALARANAEGFANIAIEAGDVRALPRDWYLSFNQVFANPPFFDNASSIRVSPTKSSAFVAEGGGLEAWMAAMLLALKPRGYGTLIYRADGLEKILSALGNKAGQIRILPIHSFADAPAKRVIIRFRKGVKSESAILPMLVLHERGADDRFTKRADAIFKGDLALNLDG